jgi:fatty-acyl-CoA synthase
MSLSTEGQVPMSDHQARGITYSGMLTAAFTRFGPRPAFEADGSTLTYAACADLAGRMRAVLQSRGVGLGTGVAVLSPNRPEAWLTNLAVWCAGGRYTGLQALGSEDDHAWICDDAGIEVLVVDPAFAERGAAILARSTTVKSLLSLGPSPAGDDLLALAEAVGPARLDAGPAGEEDIGWLQYTGGTTGRPKGVMLSHRAIVQSVFSWTISLETPDAPRCLLASPITHAAGLVLPCSLIRGGTILLHRAFDPERYLRAIQDDRATFAMAVPAMVYALLDAPALGRYDLSSLQVMAYGASPMSPARLAEAHERIGRVFNQLYGQTECPAGTGLLRSEHDPDGRPDLLLSCGQPMAGTDLRLLDDRDVDVRPGEVGEICLRSRAMMSGYWKRPDLTAEVIRDGSIHTKDMARRDDDGYVYIVDRKHDMVITGGFNVYPREVEDVLTTDPDVAAAAVIGVPDERWGEAVTAVVVPRPGATIDPARLIALVKAKKGSVQAPKTVEIVDSLPLTPVGKVDKKVLRARYWSGEGRAVH